MERRKSRGGAEVGEGRAGQGGGQGRKEGEGQGKAGQKGGDDGARGASVDGRTSRMGMGVGRSREGG